MRLGLALLLLTAFAGCVTPSASVQPASTTVALPAGTAGVLHDAMGHVLAANATTVAGVGGLYHIGAASAEPTIGVAKDGAVFMTAEVPNPDCAACPALPYANFQMGPTLMKSSDKGQTWKDAFPKLPTGDSYKLRSWDPMMHVDPDTNRVFMDDIYPLGCGFLSYSDDEGATWTHDPASCGNPNVNDHQTLGTAKPHTLPTVGYPNLVYRCVNNLQFIGCAISVDGGLSFLPQVPVTEAMQAGCDAIVGHLESDGTGRVFLPLTCGGVPTAAITEDDMQSWTLAPISKDAPSTGLHVDLALDEAGNVYALWESKGLPAYSFSTDHGKTWSKAIMVQAPGVTAIKFNAIAAGAAGKVAFAYVGTTLPGGYKNPAPSCGALPALPCDEPAEWKNATWNGYLGVMTDALSASPTLQTVTVNDPADPLSRGACGDRCHGMTDFLDVAIDHDGRPWAAFVDVCTQKCATDPSVLYDADVGAVGTLVSGPALRGEAGALTPILPPPAPKAAS
ncbi:MAG: hypothetical protein QOE90_2554 [Thermoplasmata archaeon]|jgi:hypothetical protein|nr:hypothetical protein [Thermoplasmata archaeon]